MYSDTDPRHITNVINAFVRFDANNSGKLDYRELRAALRHVGMRVVRLTPTPSPHPSPTPTPTLLLPLTLPLFPNPNPNPGNTTIVIFGRDLAGGSQYQCLVGPYLLNGTYFEYEGGIK